MPHVTIEYSAELDGVVDIDRMCEVIREAAAATGVFPLGGIRVRAMGYEHVAIADGRDGLSFVALVVRVGAGRDLATRQAAGQQIFDALSAFLDPVFESRPIALSMDMQTNDPDLTFKRNNIHDLLERDA